MPWFEQYEDATARARARAEAAGAVWINNHAVWPSKSKTPPPVRRTPPPAVPDHSPTVLAAIGSFVLRSVWNTITGGRR